jgi:hypothetical protein
VISKATVEFRCFRWFIVVAFIGNGIAFLVSLAVSPLFSFAAACLTLVALSLCIRCGRCGKSPYTLLRPPFVVGSPWPELTCSKCGNRFGAS